MRRALILSLFFVLLLVGMGGAGDWVTSPQCIDINNFDVNYSFISPYLFESGLNVSLNESYLNSTIDARGGTGGWTNTSTTTSTSLDVNVDSGDFFVNSSSGNVGIGTTSPNSKLTVSGQTEVADDDFSTNWNDNTEVPTKNAIYDQIRRKGFAANDAPINVPSSSWTVVSNFNTEMDDTDNAFDGTTFTVPEGMGGMWSISGAFVFASVTDGRRYIVGVSVNGGTPTAILGRGVSGGSTLGGVGGNVKWYLSEGDEVELIVWCGNPTSGYSHNGYQSFSAYRLNDI